MNDEPVFQSYTFASEPSFWTFALRFLVNIVLAVVGGFLLYLVATKLTTVTLESIPLTVRFGIVLAIVIGSALTGYRQASSDLEDFWRYQMHKTEESARLTEKSADYLVAEAQQEAQRLQDLIALYQQTLKERAQGFPTLATILQEFEKQRDEGVSEYLDFKKHPAPQAAEVVREQTSRRREAEKERRVTQAIIEYYESIAPFLVDLKEEEFGDGSEEVERDWSQYTEAERGDPLSDYLTIKEYRDLTPAEKNQLALDRFWQRPKSQRYIGKLYERYVGYLYEKQGYDVEYVGIFEGLEDLGRDLICRRDDEIVVVQCKNWSRFKTIYEKHIFQFFGTVFEYRDKNPDRTVRAVFITTTSLSDLARRFANELGIELIENHAFDKEYPSIKCNIARKDRQRIYHLPFDQQYDRTKIEPERGELYCTTVAEAEEAGFRRAFRYQGFGDS